MCWRWIDFEEASGGNGDLDAEASVHPEVPVAGAIDDEKTHSTPAHFRTTDIDVENVDKRIRIDGGQSTRQLINLIWRG